ncbi:Monomethylamine corrinoid protein [Desulfonema limicola]|uniref:Monomethylamine corrinoid protein n=1 Tax=Desulfonema limicola TaxID=45656 RepID=A0A975BAG3_9BACT|nr:cobalamin-dependent protein [Desulfonema limicola]QTA82009.1 Monomethylamine corrinoid protein [Desulfonema limicola]
MDNINKILDKFEHSLLSVDRLAAAHLLTESLKENTPVDISDKIICPVLDRIGEKWEKGETALSQIYMSGIICEELVNSFFPDLDMSKDKSIPIGIVTFEDFHILGKQIVKSILKSGGFYVHDFGQGVYAEELIQKIRDNKIRILLISTLMLPSALHIKDLRSKMDNLGMDIKIAVGGAPFRFDTDLWKQIGADAVGMTAFEGLKIVKKMTKELQ